ncbi:MAG TPA: hypothetical protein VFQ44_25540 [Streptosporangiaceae bacterium]|nr:hypothetical protein [Streptosporangiaceae bacterium]
MKNRASALAIAVAVSFSVALLGLPGTAIAASAKKKPPSPPPSPPPSASSTYVKAFSAIVNGTTLNLTPNEVQATSDGGDIALAQTNSPAGQQVSWLVKLNSVGVPQWQEMLSCASTTGTDGSIGGLSLQQTADGGFIVAGGTLDCGSGSSCPAVSGHQCALVVKLDPAGDVSWARVYDASVSGVIRQVRQTADGGYVAAGTALDSQNNVGAMILKLDASGNVQWQQELTPANSTGAYFNSVVQNSGGGYVATGDFYTATSAGTKTQALVASFGADGSPGFQREFTAVDSGQVTSVSDATSIISTSDGGYAVSGTWFDSAFGGGVGAHGGLLLKLDSGGNLQWQRAYTGGQFCFSGGGGADEACTNIGVESNSVHQTGDGGFVLAGDGDLELANEVPLVPWQAKVDAGGNLLWQHFYYQSAPTGAPISADFSSSALTPGGGSLAAGLTESLNSPDDKLFAASTDGSGLVGSSCGDIHAATPLQAVDPGLTEQTTVLAVQPVTTSPVNSALTVTPTSVTTQTDC